MAGGGGLAGFVLAKTFANLDIRFTRESATFYAATRKAQAKKTGAYMKDMDIKEQYEELTRQLKDVVPFTAFPIRNLVQELRTKNLSITLRTELTVVDVFNSGDISGILCTIECEGESGVACGLTHLIISSNTPFYKQIIDYQKKRTKRLKKLQR